ncbi:hypothetical protein [Hamadaea tsunoensis]|uniref:hypothetical protein n=1 Tax=Hamadaea tsunoensis TaxID=53368 RepID=UPI00040F3B77|nr:hypothetical protein [Hamadaea tsunoensis]
MAAEDAPIGLRPQTDGHVTVSWPWLYDQDLVKPPVSIAEGSPDMVWLSVRPYPEWRWFSSRRVLIPVLRGNRVLFQIVSVLAVVPQKLLGVAVALWFAMSCGLDSILLGTSDRILAVDILAASVLVILIVVLSTVTAIRRWALPEYPRLGPGDRVVVDHAHPAFIEDLIRLNPMLQRKAEPGPDAFADKYAAAG